MTQQQRHRPTVTPIDASLWASGELDAALRALVHTMDLPLRRIVEYQFGWTKADGQPARGAGRHLRPVVTLLCAEAFGSPSQHAMPAACSVQLVHEFSLLNEDTLRRNALRRGRPAAWTVFDSTNALLAGDALHALAMDNLATRKTPSAASALRELTAAIIAMIQGQSQDIAFERQEHVPLAAVQSTAVQKTAELFAAAAFSGACMAGLPPGDPRTSALRRFGLHLGSAFQYVEDIRGIWSDTTATGRPAGQDLLLRKKTLPVAWALQSPHPASHDLARRYALPAPRDEDAAAEEAADLAGLIELIGGRSWAVAAVGDEIGAAVRALYDAGADSEIRNLLLGLTGSVSRRCR